MAGKSFGGTVKLTGESEYQKALKGISDNLKVLGSEMKVVTSQYDKNDNSSAKLKATSEVLNKKIAEQEQKIKVLKSALSSAETETGKNSATTKKWQVQLNDAQAELNKMNKELDENGKNLDDSASKTSRLGDIIKGNLVSEGIIAGVKGLVKAIGTVGSAFVNVGKQAVQSFAQYEQLVGGVDTLFGESSKKVQEYASNAYKTSGLSANEYMETVTSFSASLISSLNGDTAQASEVANRAIIDMSDNANKMGTDISMIQNAYQGFAKQNYTMLDNLKLGYGGTKEEMARLIMDASKMTDVQEKLGITVKAGDMSFANIANAISVVQKNMGLMGTTALEASGTISGSTGSMQSAWQNLVTGIADDNADFETLVNNLVVSIVGDGENGGFLTNMLPRIQTALEGVVQMVVSLTDTLLPEVVKIGVDLITNLVGSLNENMPVLLESASTILNTLLDGIMLALPQLVPMAMQIIETLITTILENLPMIIEMGIQMLVSLVQGITDMLPTLIPTVISAVLLMCETLIDNIDLIIDAGIELLLALTDGILNALPDLVEKIPVIIDKLCTAIFDNFPLILDAGIQIIIQLALGLVQAIPQLISKLPTILAKIVNGLWEARGQIIDAGKDLLRGLFEGLLNPTIIWENVTTLFNGVVGGIKELFGIHSPSKVMEDEVGKNLVLGISKGFENGESGLLDTITKQCKKVEDTLLKSVKSGKFEQAGKNAVDKFSTAIKDKTSSVKTTVTDLVNSVVTEMTKANKDNESQYKKLGKNIIDSFSKSIEDEADKAITTIDNAITKLTKEAQDKLDEVNKKQSDLRGKLFGYGELFTVDKETGEISLGDLKQQNKDLREYAKDLEVLKTLVSQDLVDEIASLDAETGSAVAEKLLSLSDKDLKAYDKAFREKTRLSKKLSKNFYADQVTAINNEFTTSVTKEMDNLVKKMEDIGKDAVSGFTKGLKSKNKDLDSSLKDFSNAIIKQIKKEFKINSPSKVMSDEVGANLALGVGEGFANTMSNVSTEMANAIPTEFGIDAHSNAGRNSSTYDMMVSAFKQALTEVKVVMNGREMGNFVNNTIERAVYA